MLSAELETSKKMEQTLKEELKSLSKLQLSAEKSLKRVNSSLWSKTNHQVKQIYIAIRILSDDDDLAYYYLCQSLRAYRGVLDTDPEYNVLEIDASLRAFLTPEKRANMKTRPELLYHFEAAKWIAECRLFYWLVNMNSKGVAPPARDMFAQFIASWDLESRGVQADLFFTDINLNLNKRKAWLQSFREVWLAKFMKMPARPPMCDEDIIRKAI
jgi:hypothetical protein